ncbi:MAG: glutamine-hydrolyzing GMP synthase [Desulfobacterales bacterium]|nr:glutamine-hydrolyzing GMP synthase [Desulfobacterales bacterium]
MRKKAQVAVIDFGGQYAHLITKRLRHLGCYTVILSPEATAEEMAGLKGLILSGGPASVTDENAPSWNPAILQQSIPTLGLCYGHHLMAHALGGKVGKAVKGEFGVAHMELSGKSPVLKGFSEKEQVWMSHGYSVLEAPPRFRVLGRTPDCPVAVMTALDKPFFGVQFHPEVKDTPHGDLLLENFLSICQTDRGWSMAVFLRQCLDDIREQVGDRNVLLFLSGGVDSSVAYALLVQALGTERVLGLYIDNGFMRLRETEQVKSMYDAMDWQVKYIDATEEFAAATHRLTDPQLKRAAIGQQFIDTRDWILEELDLEAEHWLLGQGTLYPDIIESGGTAHADTIKTHHNRIRGIEELIESGLVVEPLKDLYKDEVRSLGLELKLPDEIVWRHPFPGPGLAINVLCHAEDDTVDQLSNEAAIKEFCRKRGYEAWILPVRSVGVQGDQRTYAPPVAVRGPKDWKKLEELSTDLTNTFRQVNRVVLVLSQNDPSLKVNPAYLERERLDVVRDVDHLMLEALKRHGFMRKVFQHLTIALPLGLPGKESVVLRPVFSEDVMTARFASLPWELVNEVAEQAAGHAKVADVFYDVTHKPPATFGWE